MYDISFIEVEQMLIEQENCCKICNRSISLEFKRRESHLDHCHETGKIRGVLCQQCNTGLGSFRDNPTFLIAAARYIKENK